VTVFPFVERTRGQGESSSNWVCAATTPVVPAMKTTAAAESSGAEKPNGMRSTARHSGDNFI
jgi:hypothetical protein